MSYKKKNLIRITYLTSRLYKKKTATYQQFVEVVAHLLELLEHNSIHKIQDFLKREKSYNDEIPVLVGEIVANSMKEDLRDYLVPQGLESILLTCRLLQKIISCSNTKAYCRKYPSVVYVLIFKLQLRILFDSTDKSELQFYFPDVDILTCEFSYLFNILLNRIAKQHVVQFSFLVITELWND